VPARRLGEGGYPAGIEGEIARRVADAVLDEESGE